MSNSNLINFTISALENLPIPAKGRATYKDIKNPNLNIYVTSKGAKTFFVRKRVSGRDERLIIGRFPIFSIENARKQALSYSGMIAIGKDPLEEKRKEKLNRITFGEHFNEYMERYSMLHKKSWIYDKREVNKYLSGCF